MKTAIEQLIYFIEGTQLPKEGAANHIYEKAKELLKEEKEQIIDAYYGKINGVFGYREEGEQYYNQTYNQNK